MTDDQHIGTSSEESTALAPTDMKVTHVGVCVSDLERSIAFYESLGFRESQRLRFSDEVSARILGLAESDVDLVYLDADGVRIELIWHRRLEVERGSEVRPMTRPGYTHLSIFTTRYDAACAAVTQNGGRILADTEVTFRWGNRGIMAVDPDGSRIEFIEIRPTDDEAG